VSDNEAGIRELKARLSAYLRDVKSGQSLTVTEYGEPIAQISPYEESLEVKLEQVLEGGTGEWSGDKLDVSDPVATVEEGPTASDVIVGDREAKGILERSGEDA